MTSPLSDQLHTVEAGTLPITMRRGFAWTFGVVAVIGFLFVLGVTIWLDIVDEANIDRADPLGIPANMLLPHELGMVPVANFAAVLVFVTAVFAVVNVLSVERIRRRSA